MDSIKKQVSQWLLEFLVRHPDTDHLLGEATAILHPGEPAHPRLLKAFLLRALKCELSDALFTENTLEALELIDHLQLRLGHPAGDAIRAAYCAIAVECTVRLLCGGGGKPVPKYLNALNRIWETRVCRLEKARLSSSELSQWKRVVEAAVSDAGVCETLVALNTRNGAVAAVRAYLDEAWALEGEPFIATAIRLRDEGEEDIAGISSKRTVEDDRPSGKAVAFPGLPPDDDDGNEEDGTNEVLQNKSVSSCGRRRGPVRISSDIEELDKETFDQICNSLPKSKEFENAQGALGSSSLELNRVVIDPLPEALQVPEAGIANLAAENVSRQQPLEKPGVREAAKANKTSAAASTEPLNSRDADIGNPSCSKQDNVPRPSLMEHNSTAHRQEWSDSIECSPHAKLIGRTRLNLPSPRKRVIPPLKAYEPGKISKRRKGGKWSSLEENILRNAVQKFGKGNWKLILNSHSGDFVNRTEVDLKDKWRNMTK